MNPTPAERAAAHRAAAERDRLNRVLAWRAAQVAELAVAIERSPDDIDLRIRHASAAAMLSDLRQRHRRA